MSGGSVCRCPERDKPVADRAWVVTQRMCNHSAFNGNRMTHSQYSAIRCNACRANWRSKAAYVYQLENA